MGRVLCALAAAVLLAPASATRIIDNDRVAVWDAPVDRRDLDRVVVSLTSGNAVFVPKGHPAAATGEIRIVELKPPTARAALPKPAAYPLAFPRPGSKKIFENDRVIVWDYAWTTGVATPMHFHDKDVVVTYLADGSLKSTTPDGMSVVNDYRYGTTRFNARDRIHTETLVSGRQRAIIVELK